MNKELFFRKIVDRTQLKNDINFYSKQSLETLYTYYQMSNSGGYRRDKIKSFIIDEIKKILAGDSKEKTGYVNFINLRDTIILKKIITDKEDNPYLGIIILILDIYKNDKIINLCKKNTSFWEKVITLVKEYILISENSEYFLNYNILSPTHERIIQVGKSARYFKDKGYKIRIRDGCVFFSSENELIDFCKEIENEIQKYGGINIILDLIAFLKDMNIYNSDLKRFLFSRSIGFNKRTGLDIPVGFIVNLSLKHLYDAKTVKPGKNDLFLLYEKCAKLCSLYNVQYYNQFEGSFIDPQSIIHILHELTLYDSLFKIQQFNPDEIRNFLTVVFNFFNKEIFYSKIRWDINEGIDLVSSILEKCSKNIFPTLFTKKEIYNAFRQYQKKYIDRILDAFSLEKKEVNMNYIKPHDISSCNYIFWPFVKLSSTKYLLINSSWCAIGVYFALFNLTRDKIDRNIYRVIGTKIEEYLKWTLNNKSIPFVDGYYKIQNEGQCDLAIETEETILLFEIKKKELTQLSKSGNDVNIFIDLSQTLLKSITQLNNHELRLLKQNKLELQNYTIHRKDREIEKISVTLLDYGSISDRLFSQQTIKCFCEANYHSKDKFYSKKIDELNKLSEKLREQITELSGYYPEKPVNIFHNIGFYSIPQLTMVINDSDSAESFKKNLFLTRNIRFGQFDFYKEYTYWKKFKSKTN